MSISIRWKRLLAIVLLTCSSCATQANMDIKFSGVLQIQACSLKNSEVDVLLPDFSTKEFYEHTRTPVTTFTLELTECASVKGKMVSIRFDGPEESQLPGYLSVEGENSGALGIGIQDSDGTLLKLKAPGLKTYIENDNLILTYGAFVEATPDAIGKKWLKPASYKAQASFTFNYE